MSTIWHEIMQPDIWPKRMRKNQNFFSTSGLYFKVNKTSRNVLLGTIQEPLTRPFQNTPYFSQNNNFNIMGECSKFGNFQFLTKKQNFENSQTLDSHQIC